MRTKCFMDSEQFISKRETQSPNAHIRAEEKIGVPGYDDASLGEL